MPEYKAPIKDIQFVLNDVLDIQSHYQNLSNGSEATPDMVDAIITEFARFAEQELSPLNQVGDTEGCTLNDGVVTTPTGFKEAYKQYAEAGWQGLSHPVEFGGQGLPASLSIVKTEMMGAANWSWSMYPGLSLGAMDTVEKYGTEEQMQTYLTKLVSGDWAGTMCLTEPQCGSDLGLVSTRAEPNDDGSYNITGNKIFISAGEHDMAENIIHVVLARLPNAPEGTRGISLFLVPKFLPDAEGNIDERNSLVCTSLEHKMGIHGNATAALSFDGAKGFLIGPENKGLNCMFTYMNAARLGTAMQGVAAAELSFQGAIAYATDRRAMRSLSGVKDPDKKADLILVHPNVRQLLLTQKAIAEGGRAMIYYSSKAADDLISGKTKAQKEAGDERLGFCTPILKAFLTELGFEASSHGIQVFGGHGFIADWGMEQIMRDTRISMLYEGTTGIQALDLVGRKILMDKGVQFKAFTNEILDFCKDYGYLGKGSNKIEMRKFTWPLKKAVWQWCYLALKIGLNAKKDRESVGAASVDFLMYSGYVFMAYMWARMAAAALEKQDDPEFSTAKLQTAQFYFERMLPRTKVHARCVKASTESLMQMKQENFTL